MNYLGLKNKTYKTIIMTMAGKDNGDDCDSSEWSGFVQTIKSFIKKQNTKFQQQLKEMKNQHSFDINTL